MKINCPHCNKEIDYIKLREEISKKRQEITEAQKKEILTLISNEIHSINSLSKKLGITRSTLRYYINILFKEQKIIGERLVNIQGRPTILRINKCA